MNLTREHHSSTSNWCFTFPIVNLPFTGSNIPAVPAHGVYLLQLVRYSKGFSTSTIGTELCLCRAIRSGKTIALRWRKRVKE